MEQSDYLPIRREKLFAGRKVLPINVSARYYNSLVRGHWSIENQLHWHLDVTFKEDACRARMENAPENLSILRKFALQLVSARKVKLSLKERLYKAALDIWISKKDNTILMRLPYFFRSKCCRFENKVYLCTAFRKR
jgi:hypothetical protein